MYASNLADPPPNGVGSPSEPALTISQPADFEGFLAANFEAVRRSLAVALGDPDRAEDMAQEAFARALSRWATVSVMERPVAWVYVVAMNHARRQWRVDRRPIRTTPPAPASDMAAAVVTTMGLAAAMALLPPRQRTVVVLRYLADLSIAQVAEAMGCAPGTVKSNLHRALSNLRVEMNEDHE